MNKIYTKKEAAQYLNLSTRTIERLVLRGQIDSTLSGKKRIFRDYHIEKFLNKNEIIN